MSPKSEAGFREIATADSSVKATVDRARRLPEFLGLSSDAGPVLDELKIAAVGLGSVGRNLGLHLARLQIAKLYFVDRGRFKAESLLTQSITPDDVGKPKATTAGEMCKLISPRTRVFVFDGGVEELPHAALADADLVFLATDNLTAEVEVGQRCLHLRQPLLHASVHGETLVAQVRFFCNADGEGPCPACGFGAAEWAHLNQETTFSCEGGNATLATLPTMSVSFLCSMAADLALMHMLRHVLGLGAPLSDGMVQYCGYTHQVLVADLKRNAACPCDHVAWETVPVPRCLASCTPRDLVISAGIGGDALAGVSLAVDDLAFVEAGVCRGCGERAALNRFATPGRPAQECSACGGEVIASAFASHCPTPAAVLRNVLDRPLGELGAAHAAGVVIRGPGRAVLFRDERAG